MADPISTAAPVVLYGTDFQPLTPWREGKQLGLSCTIAVTDAQAADAPVFSMRVQGGNFGVCVTDIWGTLSMDGTTTAAFNGIYFERHSGLLTHSGGTQITVCSYDYGEPSGLADCEFKVTALTATSVVYEGARFGRVSAPQTNGSCVPFFVPLPRKGLYLPPNIGLAMKLEYAALGLVVDLNINYTKIPVSAA